MSIKRRLFLSNILMLVMPILLNLFIFSFAIFILIGVTGISNPRHFASENVYYFTVDQKDISAFNRALESNTISISVHNGDTVVYASPANINPIAKLENPFKDYFYIGIIMFVLGIIVVFLINRFLTNLIARRITTPLEILESGVHEIRDGNLDFRIEYNYNDEFKAVCADFNEMAQRLSDLVNARQKDEENRKELIAGISHDLRTPLTSIKAYIEGIEQGIATTPQQRQKYLDVINRKTSDLEYIIGQLFLFSKLDVGEFPLRLEQVEIGHVLHEFVNEVVQEYENNGLKLSFEQSNELLTTKLDVVQFRNVLQNILQNSVKYKVKPFVNSNICYSELDNHIIIKIVDDGPSVSDEDLPRLFEIFYRSDASRNNPASGSGLGLAISKKIIESFGGHIHAENNIHEGLAIIIRLEKY